VRTIREMTPGAYPSVYRRKLKLKANFKAVHQDSGSSVLFQALSTWV
jgi:hypothetical protein